MSVSFTQEVKARCGANLNATQQGVIARCAQVRDDTKKLVSYQQANNEFVACVQKEGLGSTFALCAQGVGEDIIGLEKTLSSTPQPQTRGCGCGSSGGRNVATPATTSFRKRSGKRN